MKKFIVINGKQAITFNAKNEKEARQKVIGMANFSLDVIMREITSLDNIAEVEPQF